MIPKLWLKTSVIALQLLALPFDFTMLARLTLLILVLPAAAVRPATDALGRPQCCRLKKESGIGECLEVDADAPSNSIKMVKVWLAR